MTKNLTIAAAALLSATAFASAQSAQNSATLYPAKPSAYGSSYSGTAHPVDAPILASQSDDASSAPVNSTPASTSAAVPAASMAISSPSAAAQPFRYVPPAGATTQNPDYGIVTTPVADEATAGSPLSRQTPALKTHAYNPDADIVTSVPGDPNALGEGTPFHARLVEELSADNITPGTPFTAQLTRDVVHMGNVVIPVGSYIHGRVTYASTGRRIGGQSTMRLTPQEVVLPDGTHYQFRGLVTQTAGSNTRTDSEGYVINKDHLGRSAAELGMTAGSGAVIGAVVAGPVGAGVGTAIGAGVMTVHWLREKNAAVMPANSMVTFSLTSPLMLTPSDVPAAASAYPPPAGDVSVAAPATYVEPKVVN